MAVQQSDQTSVPRPELSPSQGPLATWPQHIQSKPHLEKVVM